MSLGVLVTVAFACFVIVVVPGPTVTIVIANSMRDGTKAGLLNVAGTQAGLVPMVLIVALGLDTVVALLAEWFFWIKLAGAAYLIFLGVQLWLSNGNIGKGDAVKLPAHGYFRQGVLVIWANPKALLFFGAFLPQFVDPRGDPFLQTLVFGGIFMATALVFDSLYALLAGKAGRFLTRNRVALVERLSGSLLICGGIWMASLKRA